MNLISELQRRNVFRMGLLYIVGSWLVLQIGDLLFDLMGLPDWSLRIVLGILVLGFPVALVFSWIYELTPEGIKKESEVDRSQSVTGHTARKLDVAVLVALAVAIVLVGADRLAKRTDSRTETGSESISPSVAKETDPDPVSTLATSAGPDDRRSIAVLPFVNMSDDPSNEYFSDGIAEELLNMLVKLDHLRVASRTSSFYFKGKDVSLDEIGAELDVDHIVEGSVRKAGNQVRITAQLIDVSSDSHLWSETYDRGLEDIFAVQSEIAQAIVDAMQLVLDSGEGQELAGGNPTDDLEAYESFLEGRFLLARRGGANMLEAARHLERAVELDPAFAQAWARLGQLYTLLPDYAIGVDSAVARTRAAAAIDRALELDPQNALAYSSRGLLSVDRLDFAAASEAYQSALALAPDDVTVNNLYGDYLVVIGDFDRGIEVEQRAVELDPLAEVHRRDLADALLTVGRHEEALESALRAAELDPNSERALDILSFAHAKNGNWEQARVAIDRMAGLDHVDKFWIDLARFRFFWLRGDQEAARDLYHELKSQRLGTSEIIPAAFTFESAEVAVDLMRQHLGDISGSLTWPGNIYLPEQLSTDPRWLEFWERPGFRELIELRRSNKPHQENLPPSGSYLIPQ